MHARFGVELRRGFFGFRLRGSIDVCSFLSHWSLLHMHSYEKVFWRI